MVFIDYSISTSTSTSDRLIRKKPRSQKSIETSPVRAARPNYQTEDGIEMSKPFNNRILTSKAMVTQRSNERLDGLNGHHSRTNSSVESSYCTDSEEEDIGRSKSVSQDLSRT